MQERRLSSSSHSKPETKYDTSYCRNIDSPIFWSQESLVTLFPLKELLTRRNSSKRLELSLSLNTSTKFTLCLHDLLSTILTSKKSRTTALKPKRAELSLEKKLQLLSLLHTEIFQTPKKTKRQATPNSSSPDLDSDRLVYLNLLLHHIIACKIAIHSCSLIFYFLTS